MKRCITANTEDRLISRLSDELENTFEDNIAVRFAGDILSPELIADMPQQRLIYKNYINARDRYLAALAEAITNDTFGEIM